jgi:hypothetical protein
MSDVTPEHRNVKMILCLSVVESQGSKTDDIFENIAIKIDAKVNPTRFLHVFFRKFFSHHDDMICPQHFVFEVAGEGFALRHTGASWSCCGLTTQFAATIAVSVVLKIILVWILKIMCSV